MTEKSSEIWLARHAQPLIEPGICYGQLDVAADVHSAAESAAALAAALPVGSSVVCSPLQRCELLAHALYGLRADLAYKTDSRLRELNFGIWEGRRWDDIDRAAIDAWTADFADHRPGGGESVASLLQRVAEIWDEPRHAPVTLWITHAGVIRATTLIHAGQRAVHDASQWPVAAPAFGRWTILVK